MWEVRKIGSEVASESFYLSSELDCNCYKTVNQENGLEHEWCVMWGKMCFGDMFI